jgi:hypothetical protein
MIPEGITNIVFGNSAEKQVNLQKLCPRWLQGGHKGLGGFFFCGSVPLIMASRTIFNVIFEMCRETEVQFYHVKLLTLLRSIDLYRLLFEIITNIPQNPVFQRLTSEASPRWTSGRLHIDQLFFGHDRKKILGYIAIYCPNIGKNYLPFIN